MGLWKEIKEGFKTLKEFRGVATDIKNIAISLRKIQKKNSYKGSMGEKDVKEIARNIDKYLTLFSKHTTISKRDMEDEIIRRVVAEHIINSSIDHIDIEE